MIKRTSKNIFFKHPDKFLEMLELRKNGFSFSFLAFTYNCDRTTIRHWCRKYQIFPPKTKFIRNSDEVFNPGRIATHVVTKIAPQKVSNWVIVDGEKINTGKSYADYLKTISPYKMGV